MDLGLFGREGRGRALRGVSAAALVAVLLAGLLLLLAPRQARRLAEGITRGWGDGRSAPLRIATGEPDGHYHALGTALARGLETAGFEEVSVLDTAGSLENIGRLRSGTADFALAQGGLAEDLSGLAQVSRLAPQYAHVIVPATSELNEFRQLAGLRVGVGPENGGSAVLARQVVEFYGFADPPGLVTGHGPLEAAFADGAIDAAFLVYGLFAPAVEDLLRTGYFRLVEVGEAEALAAWQPGVTAAKLPAHLYGPGRALPAAPGLSTLAVDTLLVTRLDHPAPPVAGVVEALYNADFRQRTRLHHITEAEGRQAFQLPLHPAARAWFARNDPVSADRFEIASFFLAGLVCVTSLVHYLLGRRQRRLSEQRRKAITPYFEFMLDMGEAAEAAHDPETLARLVHEMMAEQRRAERAWLAGRLDTEHMENLYAVYNIRTRNAYSKMLKMQIERLDGITATPPQRPNPTAPAPPAPEDPPHDDGAWREVPPWDPVDEGIVGEVRVRRKNPEPAQKDTVVDPDVPPEEGGDQLMLF